MVIAHRSPLFLLSMFSLLISCQLLPVTVTPSLTPVDPNTYTCTLQFDLAPQEAIYQDYTRLTCDTPQITIDPHWHLSEQPVKRYEAEFRDTKMVIPNTFSLTTNLHAQNPDDFQEAHLHLTYLANTSKNIIEHIFPLAPEESPAPAAVTLPVTVSEVLTEEPVTASRLPLPAKRSFAQTVSDLLEKHDSLFIRIILVLLLGILMSMTPCIYPMIPITVGILQAQGNRSLLHNFLISLCYTLGLATTFACLGLLAAFAGTAMGQLLVNPIFIAGLVIVLAYFAFSMFGWYEIYIPRVLQSGPSASQGGSYISVFLFGVASGSVASPCLSPGLALLLTIVATLANKFIGFILLFVFGIGIGLPLLLVGTFSSSLNMLPRAGAWMIEVKKFFGIMLLGMCVYYLRAILPHYLILWIITGLLLLVGIGYLIACHYGNRNAKFFKNIFGSLCIMAAVWTGFVAARTTWEHYTHEETAHGLQWFTAYDDARTVALAQNKRIFVDYWSPVCSICTVIENKVLLAHDVQHELEQHFVPLRIDIFEASSAPLKQKYGVHGAPVFMIIDPKSDDAVARWKAEVSEMTPAEFATLLSGYRHAAP